MERLIFAFSDETTSLDFWRSMLTFLAKLPVLPWTLRRSFKNFSCHTQHQGQLRLGKITLMKLGKRTLLRPQTLLQIAVNNTLYSRTALEHSYKYNNFVVTGRTACMYGTFRKRFACSHTTATSYLLPLHSQCYQY